MFLNIHEATKKINPESQFCKDSHKRCGGNFLYKSEIGSGKKKFGSGNGTMLDYLLFWQFIVYHCPGAQQTYELKLCM